VKEKEQFKHLYQLYLNNQCNADELKQFFELLDKSKDDKVIVALMSGTWDQTPAIPETGLVPPFPEQETGKIIPLKRPGFALRQFIAAAAVLLILTGIYFYRSDIAGIFSPVHQSQLLSANGERKQVKLADGTKVWLSPNSKLSYPDKFEGAERHIELDGEAFFEVAHDARHPFIIKSGNVNTTVLGTSFNVTAYTQQHTINVTLVTGKVAVALKGQHNTQRDTIVANQQIIVDKTASRITKVNYPDAAAFLNKRLGLYEYRGAALQEVGRDLENQYGIKIRLDQGLSGATFYGNLNMAGSLNETLNKLCTVMEATWTHTHNIYEIK
jgi:transmembrane sensor